MILKVGASAPSGRNRIHRQKKNKIKSSLSQRIPFSAENIKKNGGWKKDFSLVM